MRWTEKNIHWRKCNGIISGVCGEYCRYMGDIGILWSWRLKPYEGISHHNTIVVLHMDVNRGIEKLERLR